MPRKNIEVQYSKSKKEKSSANTAMNGLIKKNATIV